MRMRASTAVNKGYAVEDEDILYMQEREHSVQEKEAQKKLYDALMDGIHGNRIEKYNTGYKFNMDAH
eukprot:5835733-Heterocapsa_arctica.AAC.1